MHDRKSETTIPVALIRRPRNLILVDGNLANSYHAPRTSQGNDGQVSQGLPPGLSG